MAGKKEIPREISIWINDKEVVNSFAGINRAIASTNNEIKNLNKNSATYDEDLKKLQSTLGGLKEKQAEFKKEINDTSVTASQAKESISKIFLGLTSGNLALAKEGLEGINGSIKGMIKSAWEFIATPLGAAIAVAATIALAVKGWYDYNESIRENTRLIKNLTGLTGESVQNIRIGVQALADTFNVEFKSIAEAVHNLTANGLAKDEFEALEQIKLGLLKAPDKNEFLSSLKDTALTAKQVGMDLKEVIAVKEEIEHAGLNSENFFSGLQKAAKNLETQADTLKTKMSDALGAGFTKEILDKIKSGEMSVNEALVAIGKKSEEVGLNQKQQMDLTIAIFGKAGMAAGGLERVTKTLTEAQEKQTAELSPAQKATLALVDANKNLDQAQDDLFRSDGFSAWKTNWLVAFTEIKTGFYNLAYELINGSQALKDKIEKQASDKAVNNYADDSIKAFEIYIEKRKEHLGKEFNLEKEARDRMAEIRGEAYKTNDIEQQKRFSAEVNAIEAYVKSKKEINTKATADEIRDEKDAIDKQQKLKDEAAKKKKELEDKNNKEIHDKALALVKAKAELAKAELNYFIETNKSKIDSETKLTDEIVAEETKRLSAVYNTKKKELDIEKADKLEKAKLEGKSAEEIKILKEAIDLEYKTSSLKLYDEFDKSKLDLDKKYEEQQKQFKIEQLKAENELDILLAENKYEEEAIKRKQAYDKEVKDYKDKLDKKLITDKQYEAAIKVLKQKELDMQRVSELEQTKSTLGGMNQIAGAIGEMFGQSKELAIVQAGINGAMAITSTLAQYPKFDGGFAMWAAIGAETMTTFAQIGKIESTKPPTVPKFFYGGSTGSNAFMGNDEFGPVTGVVHANEWVAPEIMTQSPKYAATFTWLENERKNIIGNKHFYGGETTPGTIPPYIETNNNSNNEILNALNKLNNHLDRGIKSQAIIGYKEVKDIQKLNDERNSSIKYGTVNK